MSVIMLVTHTDSLTFTRKFSIYHSIYLSWSPEQKCAYCWHNSKYYQLSIAIQWTFITFRYMITIYIYSSHESLRVHWSGCTQWRPDCSLVLRFAVLTHMSGGQLPVCQPIQDGLACRLACPSHGDQRCQKWASPIRQGAFQVSTCVSSADIPLTKVAWSNPVSEWKGHTKRCGKQYEQRDL